MQYSAAMQKAYGGRHVNVKHSSRKVTAIAYSLHVLNYVRPQNPAFRVLLFLAICDHASPTNKGHAKSTTHVQLTAHTQKLAAYRKMRMTNHFSLLQSTMFISTNGAVLSHEV